MRRFVHVAGRLDEARGEQPASRVPGESSPSIIRRLEKPADRGDAHIRRHETRCNGTRGRGDEVGFRRDALEEKGAINDYAEMEGAPEQDAFGDVEAWFEGDGLAEVWREVGGPGCDAVFEVAGFVVGGEVVGEELDLDCVGDFGELDLRD